MAWNSALFANAVGNKYSILQQNANTDTARAANDANYQQGQLQNQAQRNAIDASRYAQDVDLESRKIENARSLGTRGLDIEARKVSGNLDLEQKKMLGGFAKGLVRVPGKGSGKKDKVLVKLAPGEAVLNKAAADKMGRGLIGALNKMGAKKMGLV